MELLTLHLFAGAGGGILADELLGFRPIGAVECDSYCRRVLLNRQADGCLHRFPVWDDVCTFRADNPATRDYIDRLRQARDRLCICGGFPCQDISAAGQKAGITGARSGLWKEYARIISEIRPAYVFVENSPDLIRRGFDVVSADLSSMGYNFTWGTVSAADVGARHLRRRFWGLAVRDDTDAESSRRESVCNNSKPEQKLIRPDQPLQRIPDSLRQRAEDRLASGIQSQELKAFVGRRKDRDTQGQRRQTQPGLGRVVNGLANWLDEVTAGRFWDAQEHGLSRLSNRCDNRRQRLRAIGNGQVPLCAAVAFVTLLKQYITFCDNGDKL